MREVLNVQLCNKTTAKESLKSLGSARESIMREVHWMAALLGKRRGVSTSRVWRKKPDLREGLIKRFEDEIRKNSDTGLEKPRMKAY